jgi:hypothetical protein
LTIVADDGVRPFFPSYVNVLIAIQDFSAASYISGHQNGLKPLQSQGLNRPESYLVMSIFLSPPTFSG